MMVNYCDFEECGEKSKYGVKQSKVSRCKDHKEEGMVTHSGEYCKHNRRQQRCKQCKGVSICEHNKIRSQCKDCKGSQICEHNRERGRCKQCKGSQICEHNRERGNCKQCKGSQICEHNKRRIYCKKCKGSQICKHNRRREKCWQCNPESNYFCIRRYDNGTRCIKEKRAKSKYDNYCTTCFVELFPEDDRSKTAFLAREELNTKRYLDTEFSGTFIYNRQLFIANKDTGGLLYSAELDDSDYKGDNLFAPAVTAMSMLMKEVTGTTKNLQQITFEDREMMVCRRGKIVGYILSDDATMILGLALKHYVNEFSNLYSEELENMDRSLLGKESFKGSEELLARCFPFLEAEDVIRTRVFSSKS